MNGKQLVENEKQVRLLNSQPLNQEALKKLQELQLKPDPSSLYLLQLAEWGLEKLKLSGPWAQNQNDLLEQVRVMYGWKNPEQYLLNPEDGQQPQNTSPQSLASELVENLYGNLQKFRPELR